MRLRTSISLRRALVGASHAAAALALLPLLRGSSAQADQFYATTVTAQPGASQYPAFTDPTQALGGPTGAGLTAGSTDVYNLGVGGTITLGFATNGLDRVIQNGPGADFIVFGNAFYLQDGNYPNGNPNAAFAKLLYVEVSSDGTNFARFPTLSLTPAPVTAYGTLSPTNVSGFAEVHPVLANVNDPSGPSPFDPSAAGGDAFDLSSLASNPLVLAGTVNLNAIRYVRLVDVIGDGSQLDSQGHPIYDPYSTNTALTLGGNVDALAVINGGLPSVNSAWAGSSGGSWSPSANWTAGVPGSAADTATFGTNLAGSSIVTLDGNRTLGTLIFDNGNASYTVAAGTGGGTLTLGSAANTGVIAVNHGAHIISAPLSLAAGANVTFLNGSSLTVGTVGGLGPVAVSGPGTLTVAPGGSLPANTALSIASNSAVVLAPNAGPSLTTLSNLSISGKLDLGNNALAIGYNGSNSVLTQIAGLIASARGSNGTAASWSGTGITSAYAAVNPASIGIGYNEAAAVAAFHTNFLGLAISTNSTAVLVQPTLYGDITLTGTVNLDDLNIFAGNFGKPTTQGWAAGDFLDEGSVTLDDLNLFAANFGKSLDGFPALTPAEHAQGETLLASLGTASVPEPAMLVALPLVVLWFQARRRRRVTC